MFSIVETSIHCTHKKSQPMEMKPVGIGADEVRGWPIIGRTGSWRRHVVKTMLSTEIVKISSVVTPGH